MASIMILNGAARKNGNTAKLVKAFTEGAIGAGNEVREFYLQDMDIKGCMGCEHCSSAEKGQPPCIQKDDMAKINGAFLSSDVVVFASPVYFWTVTGTLKTAADRLYAQLRSLGYGGFPRKCVLLMTAGGADYSQAVRWYETYERNLHWNNLGEVLGTGRPMRHSGLGLRSDDVGTPTNFTASIACSFYWRTQKNVPHNFKSASGICHPCS